MTPTELRADALRRLNECRGWLDAAAALLAKPASNGSDSDVDDVCLHTQAVLYTVRAAISAARAADWQARREVKVSA